MLEPLFDARGRVGYRSPLLSAVGVAHAFTTRHVGSVGAREADTLERLRRALGLEAARVAMLHQVHGAFVHEVDGELPDPPARADALVTERPDRLLCVRTADCVPVLASRADGRRVAAIHAGWRGLVAGVIPRALAALGAMEATRGGEGELVAAVGPCLSRARFEVGPEVADAFAAAGLAAAVQPAEYGRRAHVDLRFAALLQLERAGVRRIDVTDRCTWDHAEEFFSYRRDVTHGEARTAGHMGALIAPRGTVVGLPEGPEARREALQ